MRGFSTRTHSTTTHPYAAARRSILQQRSFLQLGAVGVFQLGSLQKAVKPLWSAT